MRALLISFLLVIGIIPIQQSHPSDTSENSVFRNVSATGEKGQYIVTGEARPKNGEYFFIVEDGHNELISERKKKADLRYPQWSKFKIKIVLSQEEIPHNGTVILYLFEKSSDGKMNHKYPVVLEQILKPKS